MNSYVNYRGHTIFFDNTRILPILEILPDLTIHSLDPSYFVTNEKYAWKFIGNKSIMWLMIRQVQHRVLYIEYCNKELLKLMKKLTIDKKSNSFYTCKKPKHATSISGLRILEGEFHDEKVLYGIINRIERYRIFRYVGRK